MKRLPLFFLLISGLFMSTGMAQTANLRVAPGLDEGCYYGDFIATPDNDGWLGLAHCHYIEWPWEWDQKSIVIAKLDSDMQLINSFGISGKATLTYDLEALTRKQNGPGIMQITDAKFVDTGNLLIAGFGFSDGGEGIFTNYYPFWLEVSPDGEFIRNEDGYVMQDQPNPFVDLYQINKGNFMEGFRSNGFVLPLKDGSIITASLLEVEDGYQHYGEIVKKRPDGTIDSDFGQNGKINTGLSDFHYITGLKALDDESFLLMSAELYYSGGFGNFKITRYFNDGQVDTEFATDGTITVAKRRIDIPVPLFNLDISHGKAKLSDIEITEEWIYVAYREQYLNDESDSINVRYALTRFDLEGNQDGNFAENGFYYWNNYQEHYTTFSIAYPQPRIVVNDNGQIVIVENGSGFFFGESNNNRNINVQLLTYNGIKQSNFGVEGSYVFEDFKISNPFRLLAYGSGGSAYNAVYQLHNTVVSQHDTGRVFIPVQDASIIGSSPNSPHYLLTLDDTFTNQVPNLTNADVTIAEHGSSYQFRFSLRDTDGDLVEVELLHAPDWIELSESEEIEEGIIKATPPNDETYYQDIVLQLNDNVNRPVEITLTLSFPKTSEPIIPDDDLADEAKSGGVFNFLTLTLLLIYLFRGKCKIFTA